jgi:ESS family glutamate:Na+ symporter
MAFTPWTLFVDFCLCGVLLIVGQFLRAKIKLFQLAFVPAALIAGLLGWILGPNCLGYLPFSSNLSTYSGILIVLVFAAMPLGQKAKSFKNVSENVGNLWAYSELSFLSQHFLGMLIGLFIIGPLFKLPDAFGFLLGAGWVGGPGTAIAIGTTFGDYGWGEAIALGIVSATAGTLFGVVGGMALIKYGAKRRFTRYLTRFSEMPPEIRTGLIDPEKAEPIGKETVSSNVLDPLMFNLGLVLLASLCAYYIVNWVKGINPILNLPTFAVGMICGTIIQFILRKTGGARYVDGATCSRIGGTCTDLLVTFAIISIKGSLVVKFAFPLIILMVLGGVLPLIGMLFLVGPRMFKENWFEKSIFTFGWASGVVATGLILLRVVDPQFKSNTLDDFAIAYIPFSVVEMATVSLVPIALMTGHAYLWFAIAGAGILAVLLVAWRMHWFYRPQTTIAKKEPV